MAFFCILKALVTLLHRPALKFLSACKPHAYAPSSPIDKATDIRPQGFPTSILSGIEGPSASLYMYPESRKAKSLYALLWLLSTLSSESTMPQDAAKPNQFQASVPQACIPKTSSCPIDIRPSESSTRAQPSSGQTSAFGSAPPKQFAVSRSCIVSKPSSSFTTWDNPICCGFISDEDLGSNDEEAPILEEASSPPKP
ncbi:uncharacterized protein BDZ99DRAFT_469637 [Mytilinidion resinicola]|uniref:Uncharacterized protein n=1 Tax=Mytilinidion resinicola TaxID=574789 RepID=A0A6A6XYW1_9PEZI|nr:uncharacterized protein BDZ99DRAFT_469637 [Mytilinidion resinicola]KAF2801443.1 hypothetical protein BDZ99DRAFT_469637 [Mytilinidion resinicola]